MNLKCELAGASVVGHARSVTEFTCMKKYTYSYTNTGTVICRDKQAKFMFWYVAFSKCIVSGDSRTGTHGYSDPVSRSINACHYPILGDSALNWHG